MSSPVKHTDTTTITNLLTQMAETLLSIQKTLTELSAPSKYTTALDTLETTRDQSINALRSTYEQQTAALTQTRRVEREAIRTARKAEDAETKRRRKQEDEELKQARACEDDERAIRFVDETQKIEEEADTKIREVEHLLEEERAKGCQKLKELEEKRLGLNTMISEKITNAIPVAIPYRSRNEQVVGVDDYVALMLETDQLEKMLKRGSEEFSMPLSAIPLSSVSGRFDWLIGERIQAMEAELRDVSGSENEDSESDSEEASTMEQYDVKQEDKEDENEKLISVYTSITPTATEHPKLSVTIPLQWPAPVDPSQPHQINVPLKRGPLTAVQEVPSDEEYDTEDEHEESGNITPIFVLVQKEDTKSAAATKTTKVFESVGGDAIINNVQSTDDSTSEVEDFVETYSTTPISLDLSPTPSWHTTISIPESATSTNTINTTLASSTTASSPTNSIPIFNTPNIPIALLPPMESTTSLPSSQSGIRRKLVPLSAALDSTLIIVSANLTPAAPSPRSAHLAKSPILSPYNIYNTTPPPDVSIGEELSAQQAAIALSHANRSSDLPTPEASPVKRNAISALALPPRSVSTSWSEHQMRLLGSLRPDTPSLDMATAKAAIQKRVSAAPILQGAPVPQRPSPIHRISFNSLLQEADRAEAEERRSLQAAKEKEAAAQAQAPTRKLGLPVRPNAPVAAAAVSSIFQKMRSIFESAPLSETPLAVAAQNIDLLSPVVSKQETGQIPPGMFYPVVVRQGGKS